MIIKLECLSYCSNLKLIGNNLGWKQIIFRLDNWRLMPEQIYSLKTKSNYKLGK